MSSGCSELSEGRPLSTASPPGGLISEPLQQTQALAGAERTLTPSLLLPPAHPPLTIQDVELVRSLAET